MFFSSYMLYDNLHVLVSWDIYTINFVLLLFTAVYSTILQWNITDSCFSLVDVLYSITSMYSTVGISSVIIVYTAYLPNHMCVVNYCLVACVQLLILHASHTPVSIYNVFTNLIDRVCLVLIPAGYNRVDINPL